MAHTKSAGAGKYGRDSRPKYLGVKKYDGEPAKPGDVLVRQRGTRFTAGEGVKIGSDDTLFAVRHGIVKFKTKRKMRFDKSHRYAKIVTVAVP